MMNLNCQMVIILFQIFNIILNLSLKKHETLTTVCPIYVYIINRISNRLVFKIKDEHKQELKAPPTMKLFGSKKN